jgi:arsenite methyltransferase
MAMACPVDLDTLKLRAEIQSIYARVAAHPSGEFHFHRGPEYAPRHGSATMLPNWRRSRGR